MKCRKNIRNDHLKTGKIAGYYCIVMTNMQMEALFGYTKTDMLHEKMEMLIPACIRSQHVEHRRVYAAAPICRSMGGRGADLVAQKKDGSVINVEVSLSPLPIAGVMHTIAIVRNVTIRKQFDVKLREAQETALAASVAKSIFLSTMSHEIRTPLHGVIGWADIMDKMDLQQEQRACLKSLKQCADSLMHIVNDVLDLSKISAGKMVLHKQDTNMHEFAQDIHATMAVMAEERGLSLTTTKSSLASPCTATIDSHRF